MSIGIIFALERLRRKSISCINVSRINVSGRVSTMVFDKTGTLTENLISVSKLKIVNKQYYVPKFSTFHANKDDNLSLNNEVWNNPDFYNENKDNFAIKYSELMVSCHSLALLDDKFLGDPLELEMYKSIDWSFEEGYSTDLNRRIVSFYPKNSKYRLHQLFQFNFIPELQRMSVIVKNNFDKDPFMFTKGSPEKLYDLCNHDELPENYFDMLLKYTKSGKRVLALAYKSLPNFDIDKINTINRDDYECNLTLIGFLIFTNPIMPETSPSIEKLKKGKVTCIMSTGDNILTSIAIAQSCKILNHGIFALFDIDPETNKFICKFEKIEEHDDFMKDSMTSKTMQSKREDDEYESLLEKHMSSNLKSHTNIRHKNLEDFMNDDISSYEVAITGKAFEYILNKRSEGNTIEGFLAKDIMNKIILCGRVYARMSPNHKETLICELQGKTGETIGMCGDGANCSITNLPTSSPPKK